MAEISASLVKELRELTGLAMMECKKALTETNGDIKAAQDLLRIKSGAKASKAAGRVTAEGVIGSFLSTDDKIATLVEVNCETDFVAKNEDFIAFANSVAEMVAQQNPSDVETLSTLSLKGTTVEAIRQALIQKIGENMTIRRFYRAQSNAKLIQYLHGTKIGVVVEYEGDATAAKDVAMHIAFAKPQFMSKDQVAADVIQKEHDIQTARAKESGKPAEIIAKMVEGALNKFIAEISLLGQPFVKDDKQTVEKMLTSKNTKILGYKFFVVGEGIEKKTADFEAEVKAQVAQAQKQDVARPL